MDEYLNERALGVSIKMEEYDSVYMVSGLSRVPETALSLETRSSDITSVLIEDTESLTRKFRKHSLSTCYDSLLGWIGTFFSVLDILELIFLLVLSR